MPKEDDPSSAVTRLAAHAREAAEASDRWLVELACEIGGMGDWARGEAQAAADALSAALGRTRKTAQPAHASKACASPGSGWEGATSPVVPELEEDAILISLLSGAENPSSNLDLLPASSDPASEPVQDAERDAAREASYPPGLLPVIDALERVIREHAGTGGASLDRDARFWTLIELLQALKRPGQQPEGEADDSIALSTEER